MWQPQVLVALFAIQTSFADVEYDQKCEENTTTSRTTTGEPITRMPKTFDYIIVGAGTSGALLASKLSDHATCGQKILILEAGREPLPEAQIPAYAGELQHTEMNWGYLYEPQPNFAFGIEDYRLPCPRGKALGGTSAINNMLHIRGNQVDFNHWLPKAKLGWTYDELLDNMKEFENYTVCLQDKDKTMHGSRGNLTVEDVKYRTNASRAFVKAFKEYGYSYIDYNRADQIGVSFIHAQTKNGLRESSYTAFLRQRLSRKNLILITEARATKILINSKKRAFGVNYIKNGIVTTAETVSEVILCAGTINSAQLLMLSGIGPKMHLKKLGIHTISNIPVGRKLYDQISFLGLTYAVNETITFSWDDITSEKSFVQLKKSRSGPLTSTANIEAIAMVDTRSMVNETDAIPNVAFLFVGIAPSSDKGTNIKRKYRISDDMYGRFWRKIEGMSAFVITPVLLRPKSVGRVMLRSDDPEEAPVIKGHFYTDSGGQDMKVMISAVRFAQLLIKMPAFKRYNATLLAPIPGCEKYPYDSDVYWECGIRQLPITLYNPQSTCQMGVSSEPDGVVTPTLKVRGIQGLRVVDASIIPRPVGGDLNAVSYLIAERMSDVLQGRMPTCDIHHRTH